MLQPDAAAVVEERLEILIVVVQAVLVAQQQLDHLAVAGRRLLHLLHVGKATKPAEMSPDGKGSPSYAVTMPTMSIVAASLPQGLRLDADQLS